MLLIAALVGLIGIILYASGVKDAPLALALGVMLASAAALGGGLVGFVFAVPRLGDDGSNTLVFSANTNLVQVSDWLTKILIGVTLVQFRQILTEIQHFVAFVQPAFGSGPAAGPFTVALLLYFSIGGFIVAYMATEIFAPGLLAGAAEQARKDALALRLTNDQLAGKPNMQPELVKSAIAAASPEAKMRVLLATNSHLMRRTAEGDPIHSAIQPIADALEESSGTPDQPE